MDRNVLKQKWDQLSQEAFAAARGAVEQAPDGKWIAASEWQVREAFCKFMQAGYQMLLQARVDGHAASVQAAFSPSGSNGHPARQGPARLQRADRRRRR